SQSHPRRVDIVARDQDERKKQQRGHAEGVDETAAHADDRHRVDREGDARQCERRRARTGSCSDHRERGRERPRGDPQQRRGEEIAALRGNEVLRVTLLGFGLSGSGCDAAARVRRSEEDPHAEHHSKKECELIAMTLWCSFMIRICEGTMPALSKRSHVSRFSSKTRHVSGTTRSSPVGRTVGSSSTWGSSLPSAREYSPIFIRASYSWRSRWR